VLQAAEGSIFIPAPRDLVPGLIEFIRQMWEPQVRVQVPDTTDYPSPVSPSLRNPS
jgi:hypothetical protein